MADDIVFETGTFRRFRARMEFTLGGIDEKLHPDEVIEFDGSTMKRGPEQHLMPKLRAAIKAGWLVPDGAEVKPYQPQPADVRIHDAQPKGQDRGESRRIVTVADEERDLGHIGNIRPEGAPEVHVARRAGEVSKGAPTGAVDVTENLDAATHVVTEGGQEGAVVGRFRTSAKAAPVEVGKDDSRVKAEIEKTVGPQVTKATGDVQEARSGDELEELLPDAASSGKPAPGAAGEGKSPAQIEAERRAAAERAEAKRLERLRQAGTSAPKATVSAGSTPVGGAEDGEIVGKVGGATDDDVAEVEALLDDMVAEPEPDPEPDPDVPPEALIQAKIEMIQQFVPGFEWDMKVQWRRRVKKALEYKDNMPILNAILSIETDAVRKHVMQQIYGGGD